MVFKTSDIVLAAFLRLQGTCLIKIEKTNQKGTFVFDDVDMALIQQFDIGAACVEPVAFNNIIRQLTTAVRRSDNTINSK